MKMTLTEKDKKLLVMLSIFVIVVCIGYWGILPVLKKTKKLSTEIETAKDLQTANETKLAWLPSLEKDNEDLEAQIVEARKAYFPLMTNSEIDKYFTALVLKYSLYSYDLTIDAVCKEVALEPYAYSVRAMEAEAEGEVIVDDNTGEADEMVEITETDETDFAEPIAFADEEMGTGIYSSNITMKLGGEEKDLLKLIDDLSADSKLRVVSFQWSNDTNIVLDEENDNYETVTNMILTLSLEIYMYEE